MSGVARSLLPPALALALAGCFVDRTGAATGIEDGGVALDAARPPDAGAADAGEPPDAGPAGDASPGVDGGGVDASDGTDGGLAGIDAGPPDGGIDGGPDAGPPCTPTGDEVCDSAMVDEDCDGRANEGCAGECFTGMTEACAPSPPGCTGERACGDDGAWGDCVADPVFRSCNGMDDDCDGTVDEGSGCAGETGCTYTSRDGSGYLICTNVRDWDEARAYCMVYGYDLATVGGSSEDGFLRSEANSVRNSDRFWIGYSDRDADGSYEWARGSSSYENSSFPGARGACAVIDTQADDWGDDGCTSHDNPFICEARP